MGTGAVSRLLRLDRLGPRQRIFAWALLFALICGVLEAAEPLEDVVKAVRDTTRSQPASGSIVVVGVDDRTGERFGGFSYSRSVDAKLVETLFALGARRVFFDKVYADSADKAGDEAFANVLARYRGRVFLGAISMVAGQEMEVLPRPDFRAAAPFRSLNGMPQPLWLSARLTFADRIGGAVYPSLSSELAERPPAQTGYYRPDWSIQMGSVPTLSFVDVVDGKVPAEAVAGKDIVVGPTATSLSDVHELFLLGRNPGVYFHVIGAETLRRGQPRSIGWLPPLAIGTALSVLFLATRRRATRLLVALCGAATFFVGPLYFSVKLVDMDVMPALLMLAITVYRGSSLLRYENTRRLHPVSGLPNLVALSNLEEPPFANLIALKLHNFPQIATSFSANVEAEVFREMERRVRIAGSVDTVYHGEEALFWFTGQPVDQELVNHLAGLHKLLNQSVRIGDREVDLLTSFGVDSDPDRPLASRIASATLCAEEAAQSGEIWKLYDARRLHQAGWQLSLMSRLSLALENGEIWVAYQPKVDLATRRIIGAEALVRWNHPTAGPISPDEFVPAAERHNRIGELTSFVLRRAVEDLATVRARGHDVGVAVNLSSRLLLDGSFVAEVEALLAEQRVPHDSLTLEITETGELLSAPAKVATMEQLARTGIRISIDDYGTGNATLEYLSRLPSQEVKIDRTFITDLDQNAQNMILVRSTLEMAHKLGRKVVAEGVENEAVMAVLRSLGCDVAQGYLLSKPIPFPALLVALDSDRPQSQTRLVIS